MSSFVQNFGRNQLMPLMYIAEEYKLKKNKDYLDEKQIKTYAANKKHIIMNDMFESKRVEKILVQKLTQSDILILDKISFKDVFYKKWVIL